MCKSNENLRCADCDNFIGGGDWNLCCKNPPKDKVGWCGFLCYADTEACQNFKPLSHIRLKPDKKEHWDHSESLWTDCKECELFDDCEDKEDHDGCYFGETED